MLINMLQKFIVCLLLLYGSGKIAGQKRCNECVYINSCPTANALQTSSDPAILNKFLDSFCGFGEVAGVRRPKICCNDFLEFKTRSGNDDADNEIHKNVDLLPDDCGKKNTDRIVGGTYADLYEFPWMALLSYKSRGRTKPEFKCGGSIINSRYVLTAAHCVKDKILAGVRVGEYDIRQKKDCQRTEIKITCESHLQDIRIEKIIIHEQYDPKNISVTNDIALIRVKNPIQFVGHKNVAPICLPVWKNLRNINLSEEKATVAGWGFTETGSPSTILKKVDVPVYNESACYHYLNRKSKLDVDNPLIKTICAGGVIGEDSCNGDSGGPLMIQKDYKDNSQIRVIQVGIVSYGPSQCGSNAPAVYTDVAEYVDWILDHIEA